MRMRFWRPLDDFMPAPALPRLTAWSVGALLGVSATLGCVNQASPVAKSQPSLRRSQTSGAQAATTTAMLNPAIASQQSPRRLQAVVNPYTPADVNHLVITLSRVATGATSAVATSRLINPATFTDPLIFGDLKRFQRYQAVAEAYIGPDDDATGLISVNALSSVSFDVAGDDQIVVATLPIQLQDREFAGEARSTATVILPGTYSYAASEAIEVGP